MPPPTSPPMTTSPISRLPPELLYKILSLVSPPPTTALDPCGDPFDPLSPASKRFMMMPSLVEPDVPDLFCTWRTFNLPLLRVSRLWKDVADHLLLQWVVLRSWQQLSPLLERLRTPLRSTGRLAGWKVKRIDIALSPAGGDHTSWQDADAWSSSSITDFLDLLRTCTQLRELLVHGHIPLRGQAREDPAELDHAQLPFIPVLPAEMRVLQLPAGLRLAEEDFGELASRCKKLDKLAFSGEWDVGPSSPGEQPHVRGTLECLQAVDVIMEDPLMSGTSSLPALTDSLRMPNLRRLRVTTLLDEDASPATLSHFTRALQPVAASLRCLEIRGASHWTDRTLWDHTLLWSVLPLLPGLEDLVLDAFMDAPPSTVPSSSALSSFSPLERPTTPTIPSVKRVLLRGYYESLYWSVQVYSYEDCLSRLSSSLRSILSPSTFPSLKLLRLTDLEPWSPRTLKFRATFQRWASSMEVTERFTRFPTEEYERVAREVDELCRRRGVRVEDRFGDEGEVGGLAPVEWCWPQYITDLYRVAGAIV